MNESPHSRLNFAPKEVRTVVVKTPVEQLKTFDRTLPVYCEKHNTTFKNYNSYKNHVYRTHNGKPDLLCLQETKTVPVNQKSSENSMTEIDKSEVGKAPSSETFLNNTESGVTEKNVNNNNNNDDDGDAASNETSSSGETEKEKHEEARDVSSGTEKFPGNPTFGRLYAKVEDSLNDLFDYWSNKATCANGDSELRRYIAKNVACIARVAYLSDFFHQKTAKDDLAGLRKIETNRDLKQAYAEAFCINGVIDDAEMASDFSASVRTKIETLEKTGEKIAAEIGRYHTRQHFERKAHKRVFEENQTEPTNGENKKHKSQS